MKQTYQCEILKKSEITKDTFDMTAAFPGGSEPGQFIHVLCGDGVLLRRPISVCDAGEGWLRFIFAVRGEGTKRLAERKAGDTLDILGPLGMGFNLEKRGNGTALVIGGGLGIFPLLMLSKRLGNSAEAILGFRTKNMVVMEDEFGAVCEKVHIATDDGSCGTRGFVTDVLKARLAEGGMSSIYVCGPTPMMKAVKLIAETAGIHCQLSLEQRMGCGIGACAVCVCKSGSEYVKVCQNGPVFDAQEVDFDG